MFLETIQVEYEYTSNLYRASEILHSMPDLFAADFEAASRLSEAEKVRLNERIGLEDNELNSTPLSHPSLVMVTHLALAHSDNKGYVIVCETEAMRKLIFNFLVTTDKRQIWHGGVNYDFKHLIYATGKIPKNFEDTMMLDKCLNNTADIAVYKLKKRMGHLYGDWALSEDVAFTKENMFNPKMLLYACTDACATFRLYCDLIKYNAGGK